MAFDTSLVAAALKALRIHRGYGSTRAMAAAMGEEDPLKYSKAKLARYENQHSKPPLVELGRILDFLEIDEIQFGIVLHKLSCGQDVAEAFEGSTNRHGGKLPGGNLGLLANAVRQAASSLGELAGVSNDELAAKASAAGWEITAGEMEAIESRDGRELLAVELAFLLNIVEIDWSTFGVQVDQYLQAEVENERPMTVDEMIEALRIAAKGDPDVARKIDKLASNGK